MEHSTIDLRMWQNVTVQLERFERTCVRCSIVLNYHARFSDKWSVQLGIWSCVLERKPHLLGASLKDHVGGDLWTLRSSFHKLGVNLQAAQTQKHKPPQRSPNTAPLTPHPPPTSHIPPSLPPRLPPISALGVLEGLTNKSMGDQQSLTDRPANCICCFRKAVRFFGRKRAEERGERMSIDKQHVGPPNPLIS